MVCYYFAIDNEYELTTWLKDPGPSFSEIKIQKKIHLAIRRSMVVY